MENPHATAANHQHGCHVSVPMGAAAEAAQGCIYFKIYFFITGIVLTFPLFRFSHPLAAVSELTLIMHGEGSLCHSSNNAAPCGLGFLPLGNSTDGNAGILSMALLPPRPPG